MAENNALTPGWYEDATGGRRYWDGTMWLTPATPLESVAPEPTPSATHVNAGQTAPNLTAADGGAAPATPRRGMTGVQRGLLIGGSALVIVAIIAIFVSSFIVSLGAVEASATSKCRTAAIDGLKSPSTAKLTKVKTLDLTAYSRKLMHDIYSVTGDSTTTAEFKKTQIAMDKGSQKLIASDAKKGLVTWYVVGTVDSENSYGAMVRSGWSCEIQFKDGKVKKKADVTYDED